MAKVVVDVGVYLPSNPDGKGIDIDTVVTGRAYFHFVLLQS